VKPLILVTKIPEDLVFLCTLRKKVITVSKTVATRANLIHFSLKSTRQLTKAVQLGIDERLPVLLPLTPAARAPEPPVTRKNKKLEHEKNSTYIRKELHVIN
jgi:hypothetical protein